MRRTRRSRRPGHICRSPCHLRWRNRRSWLGLNEHDLLWCRVGGDLHPVASGLRTGHGMIRVCDHASARRTTSATRLHDLYGRLSTSVCCQCRIGASLAAIWMSWCTLPLIAPRTGRYRSHRRRWSGSRRLLAAGLINARFYSDCHRLDNGFEVVFGYDSLQGHGRSQFYSTKTMKSGLSWTESWNLLEYYILHFLREWQCPDKKSAMDSPFGLVRSTMDVHTRVFGLVL